MNMRTFGLVAAFILAGIPTVGAQNPPERSQDAPGKSEKMPANDNAQSQRGSDEQGSQKRERSHKQEKSSQSDSGADKQGNQSQERAQTSDEKGSAKQEKSSAQKLPSDEKQKSSFDEKKPGKDAAASESHKQSDDNKRPDEKKSASEPDRSKVPEKAAEGDKSKASDSASGTSSGEAGSDTSKSLTQDRKKSDEVKSVQFSGDKRDRVQSGFRSHGDIKHETNVNVSISVGTRAPRSWAFVPVPVAVIEVVPEYRGYVFAYVEDEYVVCDPDTYEIVAVLPSSGGGTYAASGGGGGSSKCSADLALSSDERRQIIQSVEISNEVSVSGVTVGWSVPQDIELRSFPSTVVERNGRLSSCRYFVVNDQIAIVDPDQDRVVVLVDHN
jgi:hypothetical protein